VGALEGGRGGRQDGSEELLGQVSALQLLGIRQDGGEAGPLELPGRPGPEAGSGVVERSANYREKRKKRPASQKQN
jgi:hypothetical protein